jgi:hypothetical protein
LNIGSAQGFQIGDGSEFSSINNSHVLRRGLKRLGAEGSYIQFNERYHIALAFGGG